ncbi:hypothetical protein [Methylobacterium platani]|uniref:Uncharacterized protein n=1 Tax=Methylobacterium platani TaxID=427683 RepID=A0A179SH38_9HYPH|nr:hypothetical protein [Methylobacterium platani]OAS26320.1 hypothetical protein A5481_06290 [Methylobacterium platani]
MRILALDVATRTGFAIGRPGKIERSASVRLKRPDEPLYVAGRNIGFFLRDIFTIRSERPDVIVVEAPLPPGAERGAMSAILAWGCLFVIEFMGALFEIPVRHVDAGQVRKFYTGRARWVAPPGFSTAKDSNRKYGKLKVIERAKQLGHIPSDCNDDNRADACAVHYYASVKWYGHRETELTLFGAPTPNRAA